MAYKCSICSFIDVNATETPKECVSCGAVASMSYVDYQPKTPVKDVPVSNTPDNPSTDVGPESSKEGTLGEVFELFE